MKSLHASAADDVSMHDSYIGGKEWTENAPKCPRHPARLARTIRDRKLDRVLFTIDGRHVHIQYIMNPYYDPQGMNLELIGTLEADLSYEFDIVAAWVGPHTEAWKGMRSTTYKILWAADSGCSCPSPFEDYTTVEKLNVYNGTKEAWQELVSYVDDVDVPDADRVRFLSDVQAKYRELCQ